jgi:protein SCO1/2
MKRLTTMRGSLWLVNLVLLGAIAWSGACSAQTTKIKAASGAPLPGDSVYQVPATMVDQNGRAFKLEARRGQPVLVSMFYNSCQFVCPMLIDTLRSTEQSLTPEERSHLSMMLITFDPARDDVKTLKSVADQHALDPARWTLARTDAASVRKIAATLGIQYRLLADGEYNHTTVLILLDADGRIVGRTKKIGVTDPAFLKLVRQTLQGHSQPAS